MRRWWSLRRVRGGQASPESWLVQAVDRLSDDEEMKGAFADTGIGLDHVKDEVTARHEEVIAEVRPLIQAMDHACDAHAAAQRAARRSQRGEAGLFLRVSMWTGAAVLATLLIQAIVAGLADDPVWLATAWIIATAVAIAAGWLLALLSYLDRGDRCRRACDVDEYAQEAMAAETTARTSLDRAVLRAAREVFADLLEPAEPFMLTVTECPGLAESRSGEYDIKSSARKELERVMQTLHFGAIGLAGPRGVGKSTLLRATGAERPDALTIVVEVPAHYDRREFLVHLLEQVCEAVVGPVSDATVLIEPVSRASGLTWISQYFSRSAQRVIGRPVAPLAMKDPDVAERSVGLLRQLRFERTTMSGTGTGVTVLKGVTRNHRNDQQTTRVAWQPHDLVRETRRHLACLAEGREVIVAIDELDRIGTGVQATAFLADLRAIFGLPHVYFLVSVSEEALTSFEQDGSEIRDEFKSAFDDVVEVEPLTFEECEKMLRRRVLDMHRPFLALATVLGGGIPREVIRIARKCVDASKVVGPRYDDVACHVLAREMQTTIRGVGRTIFKHEDISEWLAPLAADVTIASLEQALIDAGRLRSVDGLVDADVVRKLELRMLFILTSMEILTGDMPDRLQRAVDLGWVDRLACIRATLGSGAGSARSALIALREEAGLSSARFRLSGSISPSS